MVSSLRDGVSTGPNYHLHHHYDEEQDLIQTLKTKLEEQRKELEVRYESISSIQRNFSSLSQLYQEEVNKSKEMAQKLGESERRMAEWQMKLNDRELCESQLQMAQLQYNELFEKK